MNIMVRDEDQIIVMYSETATPMLWPGCNIVPLTEEQTIEFQAALNTPHSKIMFDGVIFRTMPPEKVPTLTPEQKLATAGLTIDELKQLLGLS